MKKEMVSLMGGCIFAVAFAEVSPELQKAYRLGAESKVVYKVVDDEGNVVPNAEAEVWYRSYGRSWDDAHWKTKTDTNGVFVAQHRTNERLVVAVRKNGYYFCTDDVSYFDTQRNSVIDGKWQPYGAEKKLVLKKVRNPIALSNHDELDCRRIPAYGNWLGFDLERFDFVAPHGGGTHEDVLLRFSLQKEGDYRASVELSFTNQLFAGVCLARKDDNSELKFLYCADTNAQFVTTCRYSYERESGRPPVMNTLDEHSYLIFRTRTKVDQTGCLKSANYGILAGPLGFVGPGGFSVGRCLFNKIENDNNLEWMRHE